MDDKEFNLLEKMYGELTSKIDNLSGQIMEVKTSVIKIENKIENSLEPKLQALFDGQKQNTDILERIENEVARHEEFIIKRVK